MRKRIRARGLYQVLTLLAIKALKKDAVPVEIRSLHQKHLTSPVHPMAVYPTLSSLLKHHYVVRKHKEHFFEDAGYERTTWQYTLTKAGEQFIKDYFEEIDIMRHIAEARSFKKVAIA